MNWMDAVLIGAGLSMDACAAAVSDAMVYRGLTPVRRAAMPLCFGAFQMLMPVLGLRIGTLFSAWLSRCAGFMMAALLGSIGGKMIWDGCHRESVETAAGDLPWGVLLMQAAATSVDAFAVGIGLSVSGMELMPACILIGAETAVLCASAVAAGRFFGGLLEEEAQLAGGLILILIGIKLILS